MDYDPQNIFARIIAGEIPCNKVYEDELTLAFHDLYPKAAVHVLVIPKGAYVDFESFVSHASTQEVSGFFRAVAHVAKELGVCDSGYRLLTNKGTHANQEVPHFHMHLVGGELLPNW
jgi:histidine triad (HIT) family protein